MESHVALDPGMFELTFFVTQKRTADFQIKYA